MGQFVGGSASEAPGIGAESQGRGPAATAPAFLTPGFKFFPSQKGRESGKAKRRAPPFLLLPPRCPPSREPKDAPPAERDWSRSLSLSQRLRAESPWPGPRSSWGPTGLRPRWWCLSSSGQCQGPPGGVTPCWQPGSQSNERTNAVGTMAPPPSPLKGDLLHGAGAVPLPLLAVSTVALHGADIVQVGSWELGGRPWTLSLEPSFSSFGRLSLGFPFLHPLPSSCCLLILGL